MPWALKPTKAFRNNSFNRTHPSGTTCFSGIERSIGYKAGRSSGIGAEVESDMEGTIQDVIALDASQGRAPNAFAGRRWRLAQARKRQHRQPILAAFALALLGHAALTVLWWHDGPLPGFPTRVLPALTIHLYEPESPAVAVIDLAQPVVPTPTPARPIIEHRELTPPAPSTLAIEPDSEDERSKLAIDWPTAIGEAVNTNAPSASADPLKFAPLPQLPGGDGRAWSNPVPSLQQRARQAGGAMSSAPIAGGGLLNKLVAPSYGEYMMDSDLVDKQSECHPTADGRLYCPERTRSRVVSGDW